MWYGTQNSVMKYHESLLLRVASTVWRVCHCYHMDTNDFVWSSVNYGETLSDIHSSISSGINWGMAWFLVVGVFWLSSLAACYPCCRCLWLKPHGLGSSLWCVCCWPACLVQQPCKRVAFSGCTFVYLMRLSFAYISTAYENHTFAERHCAGKEIHVILCDNMHAWTTSDIQMEIRKSRSKD